MTDAFTDQVAALRPNLVRLARKQLRNEAWVEDAVSETLLAALERPSAFQGRAKLQSWLVGILKHKLVDQIRRHASEVAHVDALEVDGHLEEPVGSTSHFADWRDPLACLQQSQLMRQVDTCLQTLPVKQARAFVLRDCLDCETEEICQELDVSTGNLSVMLYRARRHLRAAMQHERESLMSLSALEPARFGM